MAALPDVAKEERQECRPTFDSAVESFAKRIHQGENFLADQEKLFARRFDPFRFLRYRFARSVSGCDRLMKRRKGALEAGDHESVVWIIVGSQRIQSSAKLGGSGTRTGQKGQQNVFVRFKQSAFVGIFKKPGSEFV